MSASTNLPSEGFGPGAPPAGRDRRPQAPAGGFVARGLGRVVLIGVLLVGAVGGSGLTEPTRVGWHVMMLCTVGLLSAWLLWRNARDEIEVPAHALHPFLILPALIGLGHLLAGIRADPQRGRIELLADANADVVVRLMILSLGVMLVQDVLSRVRDLRWPLMGLGLTIAVGCVLRLHSSPAAAGSPALTLSGLAGVGILLAPCCLPAWPTPARWSERWGLLERAIPVLGILPGAALAAVLVTGEIPTATAAAVAVGGSFLLSGVFLRGYRAVLLSGGLMLALGGAAAFDRLGWPVTAGTWTFPLLGGGGAHVALSADLSGVQVLSLSGGWLALACVVCGMLAALVRSLYASRRAARGDQARSALWSAVLALSGCALLAEGGLAIPAVAAVAAITWGLTPHMMAHHVRRFHGWSAMVVFAAVLGVLGLGQQLADSPSARPPMSVGDGLMHFLCAFACTAVVYWQLRCRRWWHGLVATVLIASLLALAEPLQERFSQRSFEWSDLTWNLLGAAAALGAFLSIRCALRIERALETRPRILAERYQAEHVFARMPAPSAGHVGLQPVAEGWSPPQPGPLVQQPDQDRHPDQQRDGRRN